MSPQLNQSTAPPTKKPQVGTLSCASALVCGWSALGNAGVLALTSVSCTRGVGISTHKIPLWSLL